MPESSIANLPEVFVSHTAISNAVHQALQRGQLRKLATRLYTRNKDEDPARLILRNWYYLLPSYYPDALIADRTALENRPAADGSVFLISAKKRDTALPGLTFRPRPGPGSLDSDRPFIGGARLSSTARAYLENMRDSRARNGRIARTLSRGEIEGRIDTLIRQQGEYAANRLRDKARAIAPQLGLEKEFEAFSAIVGTLLGTRTEPMHTPAGKARAAGNPFDPDRLNVFEKLFAALRETIPVDRPAPQRPAEANSTLAFFDAYFSNFIEGTEFTVKEAEDIVFHGVIPTDRPADAHDVLGTFRVVSDLNEMRRTPNSVDEFVEFLRRRHATIMEGRPDKRPGAFKNVPNRAGMTVFVAPELVNGTLEKGFEFLRALEHPYQRAAFVMTLISEVHPFVDGNGRIARVMMNAELLAGGQERIIIPTAYRIDYLTALNAFSRNAEMTPLLRMLDYAHRYTHAIDWSSLDHARAMLEESGAFGAGEDSRLQVNWPKWEKTGSSPAPGRISST